MSRTSGGTVSFQQWFSKSSAMVLSLRRIDWAYRLGVSIRRSGEPIGAAGNVKASLDGPAMRVPFSSVESRPVRSQRSTLLFELIRHLGDGGLGAAFVALLAA